MNEAAAVEIVEATEELPDDVALVNVLEDVRTDDGVDIALQKFEDNVKVEIVHGLVDGKKLDNARVTLHLLQKADLAECALGVGRVPEGAKNLLQGHDLVRHLVNGLPHNAVGALPDLLHDLVPLKDVLVDSFNVVGL